ncbi:unnamed protein product [Cochlearia groenlandica]
MNPPYKQISKHIIFKLLLLTILIIFLPTFVVSSHSPFTIHKTQRLTEGNNIIQHVITTLNQTITNIKLCSSNFSDLQKHLGSNLTHIERCAFEDCLDLLDDTISDLKTAISKLQTFSLGSHDVNMLLSDAMTNQDTCLDGFTTNDNHNKNDMTYGLSKNLKDSILNISKSLGESLDMLKKIPGKDSSLESFEVNVEFPNWISKNDRRLLESPMQDTGFNLTVAKDGTGNFTTVSDAVSAAPNTSTTRFIIYIKGGIYFENVEVSKKKTMLMFVGDGIGKTIIKSNRSRIDGWSTFQSATVGVKGSGFIAKGISFINFAGPSKHQAVALRSGSDFSAFYQCSFEGYQDTLYVHSAKQFYRDCDIFGTIDFIFGNAAVVFQNCSLYARKPNPSQKIAYTAQSRNQPEQPTGISIINCRFLSADDLIPVKTDFKAYLGRPWKRYSRTVIIKSFIDDLINPAGWLEWENEFALDTLYYGEYMNVGPGSNVTCRVKWPGYKHIEAVMEVVRFTVSPFIDGDIWLNSTGIPFNLGL